MAYIKAYPQLKRIPVFVPLNAFKGDVSFEAYIQQQMDDLSPYYSQLRRSGHLILICDGLNEMPRYGPDGRDLLTEVRTVLSEKKLLFVVSCRVRDYHNDLDSLKLERVEVRDLELSAIHEFILKYLQQDGENFWERIGGSERLFNFWREVRKHNEPERFWQESTKVPAYTDSLDDRAWRSMWQGAKLIPLARNPYLARIICSLHRHQQMPTNRAELYRAFVTDLYEREQAHALARGEVFPERERLEAFLTDLASQLQAIQTTILKRADIFGDDDLLQSALDATILTQDGDDVRFTHQLLQEYFAAQRLALKMYADEDPRPLFGEFWWELTVWRETAMMLAEFTHEAERVARWLGQASPELSVELLDRVYPGDSLKDVSEETWQALVISARDKITEVHPAGRAAAYRVLGLFDGDSREGIGLRSDDLPEIVWGKEIPPGEYAIGNDADAYEALPAHQFELTYSFRMAQYPITSRQFQAFLDDEAEGFNQDQWWEELTERYRKQPMQEQAFQYANHPRDSVSWYQAVAFTSWLTAKYQAAGLLPQSWAIRLPTQEEWEIAARYPDGRKYTWGDDYISGYANIDETGTNAGPYSLQTTTAVGLYPQGRNPESDLDDLSGNVWEWTLTEYDSGESSNIGSDAIRVLRGGSWDFNHDFARAASRNGYNPVSRYYFVGFRVVAAPIA